MVWSMELDSSQRAHRKASNHKLQQGTFCLDAEENLQREFSLDWDEILWRGNTSSIPGHTPNSPAEAEQPNLSLKLALLGGPFPSKLLSTLMQHCLIERQEERVELTLHKYPLPSATQSLEEAEK